MVLEQLDLMGLVYGFESIGGFDVILPFLLVFTLVFALMEKVKLFGETKKNVHVIVALVAAFFVVAQPNLVYLIQGFIPRVAMFIIVLLMGLLVMGMFGLKGEKVVGWPLGLAVVIAIFAILWSLSAATGAYYWPLYNILTSQDIAWLISLGVFILVIWLIVKEPGDGNKPKSKFLEGLRKDLGGD